MAERVLVTGATGFIAQHCIVQLLNAGYDVRGTARTPGRAAEVAGIIAPHLTASARPHLEERFHVVTADLTDDQGWELAVAECRFVLHVASPFPATLPKNDDELIIPARDGALRVLRAARAGGVERVVLTSSVAAIWYGRARDHRFDEEDWSDLAGPNIGAYAKSKTIAERAAWQFIESLGPDATMDLVVINPGLVLGPLLAKQSSTSAQLVKRLLEHSVPAIPDVRLATVDVRDVAAAHVAAMTAPEASGERFICAGVNARMRDVALILADRYSNQGFRVPTRQVPKFVLRVAALWDRQARLLLPEVGHPVDFDSDKIRRALGFSPRDLREMTISMADSMIHFGVVTPPR